MEKKKGGDLICMRPDSVVEARFNLTKKQNDIIDMVFASIENDDKLQYEIDVAKYSKLYKIQNQSHIYEDLKKAVKTFEGKGFAITEKISDKKQNRIYFSWFSSIEYRDGEGKIVIELGQKLKKLLLEVKRAIFYNIEYSLNFSCIYSKRLYYYLKLYEDTGKRFDNIDILRDKLECPKSYKKYANFRRFVLEPAYEEINGNSDVSFEYDEVKTKNKVTHIKFHIKSNSKVKSQISRAKTKVVPDSPKEMKKLKENEYIEKVKSIMCDHEITSLEAKSIYDSSEGDFALIEKVYKNFKTKQVGNFVGAMISMVKPGAYKDPKYNAPKNTFNDYPQRKYDYDKLERQFSGWDEEDA